MRDVQNRKEIFENLINFVRDVLPTQAKITFDHDSERDIYKCKIAWPINEFRKIIILEFCREALDDYSQLSSERKKRIQNEFRKHVEKYFAKFEASDDNLPYIGPPIEIWSLPSELINH